MPEPEEEFLISVEEGADLGAIADRLRKAGIQVESVLEQIRLITARMPPSRTLIVSGMDGVAAVEQSRGMRIAPPESEVQ